MNQKPETSASPAVTDVKEEEWTQVRLSIQPMGVMFTDPEDEWRVKSVVHAHNASIQRVLEKKEAVADSVEVQKEGLGELRAVEANTLNGQNYRTLRSANVARQAAWCPEQQPDLSFRGNELAGETGEVCNVIKKLERERQGWRGSRDTKEHLAEELADVVICADLIGIAAGIDLDAAVAMKFNATSEKVGLSHRLAPSVVDGRKSANAAGASSLNPSPSPSPANAQPMEAWEVRRKGQFNFGLYDGGYELLDVPDYAKRLVDEIARRHNASLIKEQPQKET